MKMTLRRAGNFRALWTSYDGRCGTNREPAQEYKYVCEVVSDNSFLDENGFIIDQVDVNRAFIDTFMTPDKAISCELMAIRMVIKIRDMVIKHSGPGSAHKVTVGIGVIPPKGSTGEAMITAEWVI